MKKFVALLMVMVLGMCMLTGCTESDQVSYNISKEANNFNVTRKLTVINARTDTVLFEMIGTFSLSKVNPDYILEELERKLKRWN